MTRKAKPLWETYGPWALVIGVDDALRAEFARQLADAGLSLVLTGRTAEVVEGLGARLRAKHGVSVRTLALDPTHQEFVAALTRVTGGLEIGLLVTEVGAPLAQLPAESDLESEVAIVELNLRGPARLAKHYGERMAERGRGGIVFLGSRPFPEDEPSLPRQVPGYHATLAEAFWYELTPRGVEVLAATSTAMKRRRNAEGSDSELGATVKRVLEDLQRADGRVPGREGTLMNQLGRWIFSRDPNDRLAGVLVGKVTRSKMN